MIDFTKKECIATLESFGWVYKGYLNAGWGEKFYTFKVKGETRYRTMKPVSYTHLRAHET